MPRPTWIKELAQERIQKLFEQANKQFKQHPERSRRYMELAHKISKKYNVRIPKENKKKFCPNCHAYWVPGKTCRVKIDSKNKRIKYTCEECEKQRTQGYRKKHKT